MRFCYVGDVNVPEGTPRVLKSACGRQGIDFIDIVAPSFLFDADSQLLSGDMMYRAAGSVPAMSVEQFLYADGVATFYAGSERVFSFPANPYLQFQRAGLPVPRTLPVAS